MPRGYEEGPVAEEAEARLDALERGESLESTSGPELRAAVWGSTDEDRAPHFIGWADEVDANGLFERGEAFGLTIRRISGLPR